MACSVWSTSRRKLLDYLKAKDANRYSALIAKLGLRQLRRCSLRNAWVVRNGRLALRVRSGVGPPDRSCVSPDESCLLLGSFRWNGIVF